MSTIVCVRDLCKYNNDEECNHECIKEKNVTDLLELFKVHDSVTFTLTGLGETTLNTSEFKPMVEALEKQIPQKPINQGNYEECPVCGQCIPASKMFIFCGFCGQRLLR
jgi:hypothetical protein